MDIEKRKIELSAILIELETDVKVLSSNIAKASEALADVHTMEDAEQFDKDHDIEDGLKHIRIF